MTTYCDASIVCGACGKSGSHQMLASTSSFGSPDLDTRPAMMERQTVDSRILECPNCRHCAFDLKVFDERARAVLTGAAYRKQLDDDRYPRSANRFLCGALLVEAAGRLVDAGWARLHAAWTLDDARRVELAQACRSLAADTFLTARAAGQALSQQAGASEAILTDCLRRAGRGDEALAIIAQANGPMEPVIQKVLAYQKVLIQRGDVAAHLISEAMA